MNIEHLILLLAVTIVILTSLIAKLASFLIKFTEGTRYICHEMDCAESYGEYLYWRGELRCHFLMLIPFVNKKNVMHVYRFFFRKSYHEEKEERRDSLIPMLMPSFLGIFICLVCVCGMTWAWYTASVETPTQKMTAAYYGVSVNSVTDGGTTVSETGGGFILNAGTPYTVSLTADGNSRERGGYCLISCGDRKYYTQTFRSGESITVEFSPEVTGTYTFTGIWGSHPIGVTEDELFRNTAAGTPANEPDIPVSDSTAPAPAPAETGDTYTVQSGDTLSGISEKCGISVEKLAVYNSIADANTLRVGQIIKIPPGDWEIPAAEPQPEEEPVESVPSEPTESTT